MRYRPGAVGMAEDRDTAAPVRSASAARAVVVAAGRSKKSTVVASAPWMCWSIRIATPCPASSARSARRMPPLAVDHPVASALPDALEHRVEQRVVERPRHHANRRQLQGVHEAVGLPATEVRGEEKHAMPGGVGLPRPFSTPSKSTRASIPSGRERAELEQLEQHAAEVPEHAARDLLALTRRTALGKGARQVVEGDSPPRARRTRRRRTPAPCLPR